MKLIYMKLKKKKKGIFKIELSSIWIHNDSFGLTWILKECNIKN